MSSHLRRFADREVAVANKWFDEAESQASWTLGDPVGTGESGSLHVVGEESLCGIAKPGFQGEMPRAAHEKIAADLAHILGIPVPPVALWRNPDGGAPYAISLKAFSQPLTWDQVAHLRADPNFIENCKDAFAAGYVFHVWIGDTDHGGNAGNVLVDADSSIEAPGLAFIDHAFSMSYTWTTPDVSLQHIGSYYQVYEGLPKEGVAKAAEWVQNLDSQAISDIVTRIPAAFLTEQRASLIIDCLAKRQAKIMEFFGI